VVQLHTGWRDILDRWKIEAVLVPPSCAVAQALLLEPEWHAAFSDPKAVLLLRTLPAAELATRLQESTLGESAVKRAK
jgi:hypothetical protein